MLRLLQLFRKPENKPVHTVDHHNLTAGIWPYQRNGQRGFRWTLARATEVNGERVVQRSCRPQDIVDLVGLADELAKWFASQGSIPSAERARFEALAKLFGQFREVQHRMESNGATARQARAAGPNGPTGAQS
jgi:hypothetical protein